MQLLTNMIWWKLLPCNDSRFLPFNLFCFSYLCDIDGRMISIITFFAFELLLLFSSPFRTVQIVLCMRVIFLLTEFVYILSLCRLIWCLRKVFSMHFVSLNVVHGIGYPMISKVIYLTWMSKRNVWFDFEELKHRLKNQVIGQPMVYDLIVRSISAHVSNPNPPKSLVLSLHGSTGTGIPTYPRYSSAIHI